MAETVFNSIPKMIYQEPAIDCNFEEFKKVVNSRRSVRVYTDEKIPDAIVEECLDLALLAPTSSNLQSWEFHWVKDPAKLKLLQEACLGQPAATTSQTLIVAVARTNTWKQIRAMHLDLIKGQDVPKSFRNYYEKLVPFVYNPGPLGLFGWVKKIAASVVGLWRVMPREPFTKTELKTWAIKTTALACENLMLAFRAAGYDTCPMEGYDSARVSKLLNLPRGATPVMVISAGKRGANGVYGKRVRFDRELFIKRH